MAESRAAKPQPAEVGEPLVKGPSRIEQLLFPEGTIHLSSQEQLVQKLVLIMGDPQLHSIFSSEIWSHFLDGHGTSRYDLTP